MRNSLHDIATAAGLKPYDWSGSYSGSLSRVAERLTDGKTHYYDEGTRRYHKASVSRLRVIADGMALAALELVALDYEGTRKGYRVVVHDLCGTVINDRADLDHAHATKRAGDKDFEEVCAKFSDAWAILHDAIESELHRARRELAQLDAAFASLQAVPRA